jgi:hypothetical protein
LQLKRRTPACCDRIHFVPGAAGLTFHHDNAAEDPVHDEDWRLFRKFDEPRAAAGLCRWLRNEQVDARAEGGVVYVMRGQHHRARWVVEHLPPTQEELIALAAENA